MRACVHETARGRDFFFVAEWLLTPPYEMLTLVSVTLILKNLRLLRFSLHVAYADKVRENNMPCVPPSIL